MTTHRDHERGAAAVEFALVIPVLLLLLFGMLEFSRAYNVQISLTNAAREGARVMAIHDDPTLAKNAAVSAAPGVALTTGSVSVSPSSCKANPGATVNVMISYSLTLITGAFGPSIPMSAVGAMTCGG